MTPTQPAADALAASGPALVEVTGVSKRFGMSQALSNVSMRVPAGDSRALVGRNGAGKSTLVGVLTGILAPDSGRVQFAGQDAPGVAERQKWRDRVACVYQKSTLVPTLTVAENLLLNAQPTGSLGWIKWAALRRDAERVLAGWGMEVDVDCERLAAKRCGEIAGVGVGRQRECENDDGEAGKTKRAQESAEGWHVVSPWAVQRVDGSIQRTESCAELAGDNENILWRCAGGSS